MTQWLVRFGYDGSSFAGWARQPGLRTVEGEILRGWGRGEKRRPGGPLRLEVASRTDRGVSAIANALSLRSQLGASVLLKRLNAIDPGLYFTAASPVPEGFRVRRALFRRYRYFDSSPSSLTSRWNQAGRLFSGPVDARSFGRGLGADRRQWRTVDYVRVQPLGQGMVVEVRAPSFVWGMVRKIVTALRKFGTGDLSEDELQEAVRGRRRLALPLAEADGLVLWEVGYPVAWDTVWAGPNRHQRSLSVFQRERLWTRSQVVQALNSTPSLEVPPDEATFVNPL